MSKRWLAGGLCLLLALWGFGFGAEDKPEITLGTVEEPKVFAPLSDGDDVATGLVYDRLFRFNLDGRPEPYMVESYTISEDYREYRLTLKDGLLWHDGQKVTAEDVVYTLSAAKSGGAGIARLAGFVESAEAVDERTVAIRLLTARPNLIAEGLCILPILPAHGQGADMALPVGSGGYRVDEVIPGRRVVLSAVDGYVLDEPSLRRVTVEVAGDSQEILDKLISRELDGSLDPVGVWGRSKLVNTPLTVTENASYGAHSLLFGQKDGPFRDMRVRQAIQRAIDVRELTGELYGDKGSAASPGFFYTTLGYTQLNMLNKQDMDEANRLLDEAGYAERDENGLRRGLTFTLSVVGDEQAAIGGKVAEYLKECGIGVTVQEEEAFPQAFQMAMLYTRPDLQRDEAALLMLAGKDGIYNYGGYDSPAFAEIAAAYTGLVDPARRLELIHAMQSTVAEEAAFVPLVHPMAVEGYGKQNYGGYVAQTGTGVMNVHSFYENSKTMVEASNRRQAAGETGMLNPFLVGGIILALAGVSVLWLHWKTRGDGQ